MAPTTLRRACASAAAQVQAMTAMLALALCAAAAAATATGSASTGSSNTAAAPDGPALVQGELLLAHAPSDGGSLWRIVEVVSHAEYACVGIAAEAGSSTAGASSPGGVEWVQILPAAVLARAEQTAQGGDAAAAEAGGTLRTADSEEGTSSEAAAAQQVATEAGAAAVAAAAAEMGFATGEVATTAALREVVARHSADADGAWRLTVDGDGLVGPFAGVQPVPSTDADAPLPSADACESALLAVQTWIERNPDAPFESIAPASTRANRESSHCPASPPISDMTSGGFGFGGGGWSGGGGDEGYGGSRGGGSGAGHGGDEDPWTQEPDLVVGKSLPECNVYTMEGEPTTLLGVVDALATKRKSNGERRPVCVYTGSLS